MLSVTEPTLREGNLSFFEKEGNSFFVLGVGFFYSLHSSENRQQHFRIQGEDALLSPTQIN